MTLTNQDNNNTIPSKNNNNENENDDAIIDIDDDKNLEQIASVLLEEAATNNNNDNDLIIDAINTKSNNDNSSDNNNIEKQNHHHLYNDIIHEWNDQNLHLAQKIWSLKEDELTKVKQVQELIKDETHWKNNPFVVVQLLKEHNWNVKQAVKFFHKLVRWRKQNNIDTILNDYTPPHEFDHFPVAILRGCDKDGDPIQILRTGASHPWELVQKFGIKGMLQREIYNNELITRGSWIPKHHNNNIYTADRPMVHVTTIMDLEGLNKKFLRPALLQLMTNIAQLTQDYYPSFSKRIIVIRVPDIFSKIWKAVKPLVRENVKNSLVFATKAEYLDVLQEYMDITLLPPCINPETGTGDAIEEFTPIWEGGSIILPASLSKQAGGEKQETIMDDDDDAAPSIRTQDTATIGDDDDDTIRNKAPAPAQPKCKIASFFTKKMSQKRK